MRQLIAVALFCAGLFCIAQAQVTQTGAGLGAPSSGGFSPSCSQSSTFLTAATGVTLTADKTNYDTLICGLVTDGVFSGADVFYMLAAPSTTNAALINIVNPGTFNGTAHGTVSFSAYVGYTGDGSTFYIDTGFNPVSASSPNYVLNSAQVSAYVQSNLSSGQGLYTVGVGNNGQVHLAPDFFGNTSWSINDQANISTAATTTQGYWVISRTAAGTLALYRNGNTTPFGTSTQASVALPNDPIAFFAENSSGTIQNFASVQASAFTIGSGLTATAMNHWSNRINTYLTAYGNNVY